MPEPVTMAALALSGLGWIIGTVAGGVAGNVTDRALCNLLRGVKDRMAGLP